MIHGALDADFTQLIPSEFHADLVVRVDRPDGAAALGVVVELQRAPDPDKRFSWPLYVAALHARLRCPICLLVSRWLLDIGSLADPADILARFD